MLEGIMKYSLIEKLQKDIRKLTRPLKDEDEVIEVLKRRLTKKEFKYYKLSLEDINEDNILKELNCDKERLEEISKTVVVKVNQEKIKHELMN
jgi:reverse gyrase